MKILWGMGVVSLVWVAACSGGPETTGSQGEKSVGGNVQISGASPLTAGQETAAAVVTGTDQVTGQIVDNLVIFYNANPKPLGTGNAAWSVSNDAPAHQSWAAHYENQNANDSFFNGAACTTDPDCGNPALACNQSTHACAPKCSDGNAYSNSAGDPGLVATGWDNQLAFTSLANSTINPVVDISLAVSNDSGASFKNLTIVSDANSGGTTFPPDQPKIVMMQKTHVAYIVWAVRDPNNSGNWHAFMRRFHFLSGGTFDPPGPVIDMQLPMDWRNSLNNLNIVPVCDVVHQSVDNCAGGTEQIFVGYPTLGQASGYWPRPVGANPVDCAPGDFDPNTEDIQWTFWLGTPGSWGHRLDIEDQWNPVCVIAESIGGVGVQGSDSLQLQPGNQRWIPAMAFDPREQRFHIAVSMSKYWHNNNGNPPDDRGTRIFQVVYDGNNPPGIEELSPVTTMGATTCTTVHPDDECYVAQFAPSMAIMWPFNSDLPWGAIAWHDTRLTINSNSGSGGPGTGMPTSYVDAPQARISRREADLGTWDGVQQVALGAGVPFTNTGNNGNTPWGDYEGMAADIGRQGIGHPPAFYPAWGDNRDGTTNTQVFTAELTP